MNVPRKPRLGSAVSGDNPLTNQTPVRPEKLWLVLAGLMLALMLAALDQNIVATALPRIVIDLGGLGHLSWVVTAFMVASTMTTPLYGKLSDMFGRKPAFFVSITIFLIGSALCGQARDITELILFRAVQGLGAGGLIALSQTVISDLVSPRERGRYQGLFAGVFATCSVAGPLLGGLITDALSWHWIFYVNLPIGAAAMALIGIGLRHRPRRVVHKVDYFGALLLSLATCSGLLALSWGGNTFPWVSPVVLGLAATAIVSLGLLVVNERRAAEPLLPPRLFGSQIFVLSVLVIGLAAMGLFAAAVFLPLYFQLVQGARPTTAGLLIAPMMGGVIVSSVLGGRLVSHTGHYKRLVTAGLLVAAFSFAILAWNAGSGGGVPIAEVTLVTLGLGIGVSFPNLTTAIQNAVDRQDLGAATATAAFFRSLGGAVGVALSGAILTARLQTLLPSAVGAPTAGEGMPQADHATMVFAYRHALSTTFLAGAIIASIACLVVALSPERPLSPRRP
ncbi:MDR family MFS transporter [Rhodopila sp.]|uniref:MDR family MFS transporter n=1 Tax=Rhodopila sp. TaxID=2480087 RepID=UPI003D0B065C